MSEQAETNAAEARRWLAHAREDLLAAERIGRDVELPSRLACFLAQLAAEKALKAYLISFGIPFRKVHDLRELFALLPTETRASVDVRDLDRLNPWVTEGRYPGDAPDATQSDADECIAAADRVVHALASAVDAQGST